MEDGKYGKPAPIDSYLRYELSGVDITDSASKEPVCKRCDDLGESDEKLRMRAGETALACANWEALSGWELFGVYHEDHSVSGITDSDPPRPTAVLRGTIERTGYGTNGKATDTYTLVDLTVVEFSFPHALGQWRSFEQ